MKITNKKGFPEALEKAVINDSYSKGNAKRSVTGLLSPPRQSALSDMHWDELTEDVSDRTFALYGQLIHLLLERAGEQSRNQITEERLFTEVGGWAISGQTDSLTLTADQERWVISDYKFVTAYKFQRDINGVLIMDEGYENQLNLYAYLLEVNGFVVDGLNIIAIYRDWSKMEAKRNANYPQLGAETHTVALWSHDRAKAFIEERVRLHQVALYDLPECTPEERWAKPDKFALMPSKTSKRARKLFSSHEEAVEFAHSNPSVKAGWVIEHRKGANIRCENYCLVSEFCEQFKAIQWDDN